MSEAEYEYRVVCDYEGHEPVGADGLGEAEQFIERRAREPWRDCGDFRIQRRLITEWEDVPDA